MNPTPCPKGCSRLRSASPTWAIIQSTTLSGLVNVDEEIAKLEKDLAYQQKFLAGVRGKLANERFVANAPAAVIENERKKEADSLSKIESLESQIKALKNS